MFGPEYMNGRRTADHKDDGAFDNTSCGLVSKRLTGGWWGSGAGDIDVDKLT